MGFRVAVNMVPLLNIVVSGILGIFVCIGLGKSNPGVWKSAGYDAEGNEMLYYFHPNQIMSANYSSKHPTISPSLSPTTFPSKTPTNYPSNHPTNTPTTGPTQSPSKSPTYSSPTDSPSINPTTKPTQSPSDLPTYSPTQSAIDLYETTNVSSKLSARISIQERSHQIEANRAPKIPPTLSPTLKPTKLPTKLRTLKPTKSPTLKPTKAPTTAIISGKRVKIREMLSNRDLSFSDKSKITWYKLIKPREEFTFSVKEHHHSIFITDTFDEYEDIKSIIEPLKIVSMKHYALSQMLNLMTTKINRYSISEKYLSEWLFLTVAVLQKLPSVLFEEIITTFKKLRAFNDLTDSQKTFFKHLTTKHAKNSRSVKQMNFCFGKYGYHDVELYHYIIDFWNIALYQLSMSVYLDCIENLSKMKQKLNSLNCGQDLSEIHIIEMLRYWKQDMISNDLMECAKDIKKESLWPNPVHDSLLKIHDDLIALDASLKIMLNLADWKLREKLKKYDMVIITSINTNFVLAEYLSDFLKATDTSIYIKNNGFCRKITFYAQHILITHHRCWFGAIIIFMIMYFVYQLIFARWQ